MKTAIHTILTVLLLSVAGAAAGQPARATLTCPSEHGRGLLVRQMPDGNDLIYEYSRDLHSHTFLCRSRLQPGRYLRYEMPPMSNYYGSISYTVTDMEVVGDVCFICGTMTSPTGDPEVPILRDAGEERTGYVCRVELDSIAVHLNILSSGGAGPRSLGSNLKYKFHKLKKTSGVTRMAVQVSGADTVIGLVGRTDSAVSLPCVVLLRGQTGEQQWYGRRYSIDDPAEDFTDIGIGEKSLFTVSRFEGEHRTFGMRSVGIGNFFEVGFNAEFKHLYKFDAGGMSPAGTTVSHTWHPDAADIRLVAMPSGNDVTVAYEGREYFTTENVDYFEECVNLFRLTCSSAGVFAMAEARELLAYVGEDTCLGEVRAVGRSDSIALVQSRINGQGAVTKLYFFKWGVAPTPVVESQTHAYTSMDISSGRVSLVGSRASDGSLLHHRDIPGLMAEGYDCFYPAMESSPQLLPLAEPEYTESPVGPHYKYNIFQWNSTTRLIPTTHPWEVVCDPLRSALAVPEGDRPKPPARAKAGAPGDR